jgi:murein tripeptide amidase MpaA
MPKPDFSKYYRYHEQTELLQSYVREYPKLATLESIGKSYEGRDIWALTINNPDTGAPLEKPGFYIDGNIHGSEVTASAAAVYIAWRLLSNYGKDDEVARLVDGTAFYIIPMVSPDGVEFCLSTPGRVRSGVRLYPDEEPKDGLEPEDINGDGLILQMRIADPGGGWKVSPKDARLLVPRAFDDAEGTFYRVHPEGLIRNFDGVEIKEAPSKHGLDFNRNFPANWAVQSKQKGAGEYPFSEPETRAIGNFVLKHPNICGLHTFHTGFESIIRPPCTTNDKDIPREDLERVLDIGNYGKQCTGYVMFSYNQLYENIYVAYGDFATWAYDHLGLICYCDELWDLRARGCNDPMELAKLQKERNHEKLEEFALAELKWNDEVLGGSGFVNWRPFEHPQLGQVEIGGWKPLLRNNAPPQLMEQTCHNIMRFVVGHAKASPRIRAWTHETQALGDNVYRIAIVVQNDGYLPTNITRQAINVDVAKPVDAFLELGEGDQILLGKEKETVGCLSGYGGRKKVEWLIQFKSEPKASVKVVSQKGGTVRLNLDLKR